MKRDWLQLISNAAIIIGLAVVIYELDQNRRHVRGEIIHADYTDILAHQFAVMGDDPAEAIALAMNNPEDLSDTQKLVVDAHLRAVFTRLDSYSYIADSTGIYPSEGAKESVPRLLKTHFNYEYAREWWGRERTIPRPWATELISVIDKELGFAD